jgi:hypothetical protein
MSGTMWQALARYLGSNTTAFPSEEAETIFIAETNDWRAIVVHEQGSNVEIEKVTEALHRGIKGRRLPDPLFLTQSRTYPRHYLGLKTLTPSSSVAAR